MHILKIDDDDDDDDDDFFQARKQIKEEENDLVEKNNPTGSLKDSPVDDASSVSNVSCRLFTYSFFRFYNFFPWKSIYSASQ